MRSHAAALTMLTLAFTGLPSVAAASECKPGSAADPSDSREKRHQLALELDRKVALLEQDVATKEQAAKDSDTRLHAAEALVAQDSKKASELTTAAQNASATRKAWSDAKEALDCAKLAKDAAWTRFWLAQVGGNYLSVAASAMGAAGGANAVGGNLTISVGSDIAPNYELGIAAASMQELYAKPGDRTAVFGPLWRVNFTWLHTGVFLGVAPSLHYRDKDSRLETGAQFALSGQVGVRIRTTGCAIGLLRLFMEPHAVLDGSTPFSVFFGAELGLGMRVHPLSKEPEPDVGSYTYTP